MTRVARLVSAMAVLGLVAVPVASAQGVTREGQPQHRPRPAQVLRNFKMRLAAGGRAHQITPEERTRLRGEFSALRALVQSTRRAGEPRAPEDRAKLRASLRRINRLIYESRHNGR